jgi:hypothetical protein
MLRAAFARTVAASRTPAVNEDIAASNSFLELRDSIIDLPDSTPRQAMLRAQAWTLFQALQQRRWDIIQEAPNTLPKPVLYVLVAWIALIFVSFGHNAPNNLTVLVTLFISSAAIGGAIFLVDEMEAPFDGVIQISGAPMQKALAHLLP